MRFLGTSIIRPPCAESPCALGRVPCHSLILGLCATGSASVTVGLRQGSTGRASGTPEAERRWLSFPVLVRSQECRAQFLWPRRVGPSIRDGEFAGSVSGWSASSPSSVQICWPRAVSGRVGRIAVRIPICMLAAAETSRGRQHVHRIRNWLLQRKNLAAMRVKGPTHQIETALPADWSARRLPMRLKVRRDNFGGSTTSPPTLHA